MIFLTRKRRQLKTELSPIIANMQRSHPPILLQKLQPKKLPLKKLRVIQLLSPTNLKLRKHRNQKKTPKSQRRLNLSLLT